MFSSNQTNVEPPVLNYIEDVFSTWLYDGTGATQTITNGIDLSTKGGMTWIKCRTNAYDHEIFDTARGVNKYIIPNKTVAQDAYGSYTDLLTSFNTTGFTLGADASNIGINRAGAGQTYASWTFRKQPKFFDVVTYTGDGNSSRVVSHSLTSQPGFIAIKRTSGAQDWIVAASDGAGNYKFLNLNTTSAALDTTTQSNVASTTGLNVGWISSNWAGVNASGTTFVAYIFAHNAGGFGLTGTDNVISCGSFTTDSGGAATVSLGYEPQWLLVKKSSSTGTWYLLDVMRGLARISFNYLVANTAAVEESLSDAERVFPFATGFQVNGGTLTGSAETFIYIAIRKGPMKIPTDATKVFTPVATGSSATNLTDTYSTIGFPIDMTLRYQIGTNTSGALKNAVYTRLLGINSGAADTPTSASNPNLLTHSAGIEDTTYYYSQDGSMGINYGGGWGAPSYNLTHLHFRRAPSVFDVCCYTGTGATAQNINHNLGVVPELMIVKVRNEAARSWTVYSGNAGQYLLLDTTDAVTSNTNVWNNTTPTSSVFRVGNFGTTNSSGKQIIAYLFATCAGVSKVGTFTGNGSTQTINCGFTGGARFVLIKRTDSTGDWYAYDTARGMTSLTDPYILLNSTAAQTATLGSVTTATTGFALNSSILAAINISSATYIFLAIA